VEYQRIGAGLVPAGLSTDLCLLPLFVGVVGVGCGKGWLVAGSVVYGTLLGPEATGAGLFPGRGADHVLCGLFPGVGGVWLLGFLVFLGMPACAPFGGVGGVLTGVVV
jgi:hypothetical protein